MVQCGGGLGNVMRCGGGLSNVMQCGGGLGNVMQCGGGLVELQSGTWQWNWSKKQALQRVAVWWWTCGVPQWALDLVQWSLQRAVD